MTLDELAAQASDTNLLLGCRGVVFNMTSNSEAYGPGKGYNAFIGHDASVALAKMEFGDDFMDPSKMHWKDLNKEELDQIDYWVEKFSEKYEIVGYIKDDWYH